jgi:hypothetical protein
VQVGDPARLLRVFARDVDGNEASHHVWIRGPRRGEEGPDTTRAGGRARKIGPEQAFRFAVLPGRYVRIAFLDAPKGSRGVRIQDEAATYRRNRWSVVLPFRKLVGDTLLIAEGEVGGSRWRRQIVVRLRSDDAGRWSFEQPAGFEWWMESEGVFEPALLAETSGGMPRATAELAPRSSSWTLDPNTLALRK